MTPGELLASFARRWGIGDPEPRPDGAFALFVDQRDRLEFLPRDRHRFVLFSTVGPVPRQPDLAARLLRFQLARIGDHGSVLSIDPATGDLVLAIEATTVALDDPGFDRLLVEILDDLGFWRDQIGGTIVGDATTSPRSLLRSPPLVVIRP